MRGPTPAKTREAETGKRMARRSWSDLSNYDLRPW